MRKSFLMLGAAIAALTSCTQSEVLEIAQQPERPIGFEPFVEKQTRAVNDITDGNTDFKEFYVFAAKGIKNGNAFTEEKVTDGSSEKHYLDHQKVTGGRGNWTYEPHVAWIASKTFRFAAYADGIGNGTGTAKLNNVEFVPTDAVAIDGTTTDKWGLNINDYTASDKDLIAAVPEEKVVGAEISTAPPSVGLTFKHLLAKVIIQLRYTQNAANNNLELEVVPFSFKAYKKGDCEVRYTGVENNTVIGATWTPKGTTEAEYAFFPKVNNKNQTWPSGNIQSEAYVIPQSNAEIEIGEIIIYTKNSAGETTSTTKYSNVSLNIPDHTEWKPGYVYRYIADITPGEHYIHFTTSVTSWIDEDSRNQTIQ